MTLVSMLQLISILLLLSMLHIQYGCQCWLWRLDQEERDEDLPLQQ